MSGKNEKHNPSGVVDVHDWQGERRSLSPNEYTSPSIRAASIRQQKHKIGPLRLLALAYSICSSWIGIATTLAIAVASGGTVTAIYGVILISFIFTCTGLTLSELSGVYPTAGGQYHFTSILAPPWIRKQLSYTCGLLSVFSWMAFVASVTLLTAQLIFALVLQYNSSYELKAWHLFCVYIALSLAIALYTAFGLNWTEWIFDLGLALTFTLFVTVIVSCPIRSPSVVSSKSIWVHFVNPTGWSDGVSFLIGMVTPQFMFIGIDGVMHLAEECQDPKKDVPKTIMWTVAIGFATGFLFTVVVCYYTPDILGTLAGRTGYPFYEMLKQCLQSDVAATVLAVDLLLISVVVMSAGQQTASRMTWAFARDDAIAYLPCLGQMHPTLEVPIWSVALNFFFVCLIGVLYLASTTAFNSFIQSAALLQQLSFGIPAALLVFRKRSSTFLPDSRLFRLPNPVGYFANVVCAAWTVISLVFYCFPAALPVTAASMNYTVVVLFFIGMIGIINWFVHGRKHYTGPIIEMM